MGENTAMGFLAMAGAVTLFIACKKNTGDPAKKCRELP
jgi:hypothetical protein